MCATLLTRPTKLLPKKECNLPCSGSNDNETCGGARGIEWFSQQVSCEKGEKWKAAKIAFWFHSSVSVARTTPESKRPHRMQVWTPITISFLKNFAFCPHPTSLCCNVLWGKLVIAPRTLAKPLDQNFASYYNPYATRRACLAANCIPPQPV